MSEEIEPGRPVVLRGGNVLTTCNRWGPRKVDERRHEG